MKRINVLIGIFVGTIVINALLSSIAPLGAVMWADAVKLAAQVLLLLNGLFILNKIRKRDPMTADNETIRTLVHYKDNSRKYQGFPASILIMAVFGLLTLGMIVFQGMTFYYFYFM